MGRVVLLLVAAEIVGGWLLVLLFDLVPWHAFVIMIVALVLLRHKR